MLAYFHYDASIKDEYGNITGEKSKVQLFIKPKSINVKTFFSGFPIESNLLATIFIEPEPIARILYINPNKKSLAQQLISHSNPYGKDRTEVVSNSGFYSSNLKQYIKDVNSILKLKNLLVYDFNVINQINKELKNNQNLDINTFYKKTLKEPELIKNYPPAFKRAKSTGGYFPDIEFPLKYTVKNNTPSEQNLF